MYDRYGNQTGTMDSSLRVYDMEGNLIGHGSPRTSADFPMVQHYHGLSPHCPGEDWREYLKRVPGYPGRSTLPGAP